MAGTRQPMRNPVVPGLTAIVGFLVCVELASGVLQGYYTPIFPQIADHLSIRDASVNWFEAAQLVVSALVVPVLAKLGDLVGHRKVLLLSTAVTAVASWAVAFAPTFTTLRRLAPGLPFDLPEGARAGRPEAGTVGAGRKGDQR